MIQENKSVVAILDSSHEEFKHSIEQILILFEHIKRLVSLICPEAVLLLQVSDNCLVVLMFILFVVFE